MKRSALLPALIFSLAIASGCGTAQPPTAAPVYSHGAGKPLKSPVIQWLPYVLKLDPHGKSKLTVLEYSANYSVDIEVGCFPSQIPWKRGKQWTKDGLKHIEYSFRAKVRGPFECQWTATLYSHREIQAPLFIEVKKKWIFFGDGETPVRFWS